MKDIYKQIGIYRITNKENGMSYIGKTSMNFGDRWDHHRALLNGNKHSNHDLQNDWNQYGKDNFEFCIVEAVENDKNLNELEKKYVSEYKKLGKAYNIHSGGDDGARGMHLSEDTKRKIGDKNREHMTGRKLSDETRKKMSESQQRRYESWTDDDRKAYGVATSEYASGYKWSEESKAAFSKLQREHPNSAKFTADDIRAIREKRAQGVKLSVLAQEYGTTDKYISMIAHRKRWAEID